MMMSVVRGERINKLRGDIVSMLWDISNHRWW